MNDIINEKLIENSDMLPLNVFERIKKSLCKIEINGLGTGILLKLQKKNDFILGLITCQHVIEEKFIMDKKEIKITYFNNNDTFKEIIIKLDERKRFIRNYLYLNLDITFVQIYPTEIEEGYFLETKFFEIKNEEDLINKTIYIFHYPKGDKLSYSPGCITSIENKISFCHKASTEKGSSGAPIFIFDNNNLNLIGIHKGALKDNNNIGHFIYPAIISLKEDFKYLSNLELIVGIFEGEFLYGNIQKGKLIHKDEIYIGQLYHYKRDGFGILYEIKENNKKKEIYSGYFKDGKYEGKGKLFLEDGFYYKGNFIDNQRKGKGILYNKNSKIIYEGDFENDKFNGNGKIYYDDGSYYEGQFVDNKRHGKGILYNEKKQIIFEGNFENDEYEKKEDEKKDNNKLFKNKESEKEFNKRINGLLSLGKVVGEQIGVDFTCDNCNCSTKFHGYNEKTGYWDCNNCKKECSNNPSAFFGGLLNFLK